MTDGLASWIEGLRPRFGTMREIAEQIGMSESGLVRGVKRGTLGLENLLDLARVAEEHPSKVLRLAGKERAAELIEVLYGPGADSLKSSERKLLDAWRDAKDDDARAAALGILEARARVARLEEGIQSRLESISEKEPRARGTSARSQGRR